MELIVYNNFSKKKNSTLQPSGGTVYNITLKNPCSTINPVFLIDGVNLQANYCKWNGRYYYIDNIVLRNNNVYELHCSVDTLATYKASIGSSTQYVVRSSADFDTYVSDAYYPTKADVEKDLSTISVGGAVYGGFPENTLSRGTFVVGIANSDPDTNGGVSYYEFNNANFRKFCQAMFLNVSYFDEGMSSLDIKSYKMQFNPMQYIISCKYFPWLPADGNISSIPFGWWSVGGGFVCRRMVSAVHYDCFNGSVTLKKHPQVSRGKYLNASPFTQMSFRMYPFGEFPIDSSKLVDETTLNVNVAVDEISGQGVLSVYKDGVQYVHASAQIGVDIALTQVLQNYSQVASDVIGLVNPISILSSFGTSVLQGINDIKKDSMAQVKVQGSTGSMAQFVTGTQPFMHYTFFKLVDEDNSGKGRPLCKNRTISSIPGYIECSDVHLTINGTPAEKDEIVNYMQTGFFYE